MININLYQPLISRVFERLNSGSTLIVDLFEYCGHAPSVAEDKNEWTYASIPPMSLHCVYSDNFLF
jgi:hypothetical protein